MWPKMIYKTLRWEWLESLEEVEVKHMVTRQMMTKADIFGQITVRFHSRQKIAIYDRFGRLAFGNDKLPTDVLEFVVFERYLSNPYSQWRMHDKIVPDWITESTPVLRSFVMPAPFEVDQSLDESLAKTVEKRKSKFKSDDSHLDEGEPPKKEITSS